MHTQVRHRPATARRPVDFADVPGRGLRAIHALVPRPGPAGRLGGGTRRRHDTLLILDGFKPVHALHSGRRELRRLHAACWPWWSTCWSSLVVNALLPRPCTIAARVPIVALNRTPCSLFPGGLPPAQHDDPPDGRVVIAEIIVNRRLVSGKDFRDFQRTVVRADRYAGPGRVGK